MPQTATSNKLTHITIDSPFGNTPYNGLTSDYYCAPGLVADYNAYGTQGPFSSFEAVSFNPIASFTGAIDLATWKGLGFDTHSVSLTANPFDETPKEALYETFAISPLSTAYTAGVGGAICGAIDNSNRIIGANF